MPVGVGDVLAMIDTLRQMVTDIKQANKEVKNLSDKTLALVHQVAMTGELLKPVQEYVRRSDPSQEGVLSAILADLGTALIQAHHKLDQFEHKSALVGEGNRVWETAKAFFGRGAAKLNRRTSEITDDLRKLLVDLSLAIGFDTHAAVQTLVQQQRRACRDARPQYPVVLRLDELASSCLDNDVCNVTLMIADSHSNEFRVPTTEEIVKVSSEGQRGAREGGIEVGSCTKILLLIRIEDEERFLNVVIFDNQQNEPPELFFPKTRGAICKLSCDFERQFPNQTAYKTDPPSFKVEKDASLTVDTVSQQSVYLVLTTEQLKPLEDSTRILTIEDLEKHLNNDEVFVKRFVFDMK